MSRQQWLHGYKTGYQDALEARYKFLFFENSWKDFSHCWKVFLFKKPIRINKPSVGNPFLMVSVFGFLFVWQLKN